MNPLGLVVAPIINLLNLKKRTGSLVRYLVVHQKIMHILLLITSLTLGACQHIRPADSPLPISTKDTISTNPPQHTPKTPHAPPPTHDKAPFFLLENWF